MTWTSSSWALVCPASRGIGFYLTRHLLQHTSMPIVATVRKDAIIVKRNILEDLPSNVDPKRLMILTLDVTDESTIAQAADEVQSIFPSSAHNFLHLAFCLPGILHPEKSPSQIKHVDVTQTFAINTIGQLLMIKHFSSFLPRKKSAFSPTDPTLPSHAMWLNMSARVGSITDNNLGGWYSYRASKAAVNSITKSFDLFLRSRSGDLASAISYHPGTVKTGLSKDFWSNVPKEKLFDPEFAVAKMWDVVRNVGLEKRGNCFDWRGDVIAP